MKSWYYNRNIFVTSDPVVASKIQNTLGLRWLTMCDNYETGTGIAAVNDAILYIDNTPDLCDQYPRSRSEWMQFTAQVSRMYKREVGESISMNGDDWIELMRVRYPEMLKVYLAKNGGRLPAQSIFDRVDKICDLYQTWGMRGMTPMYVRDKAKHCEPLFSDGERFDGYFCACVHIQGMRTYDLGFKSDKEAITAIKAKYPALGKLHACDGYLQVFVYTKYNQAWPVNMILHELVQANLIDPFKIDSKLRKW